MNNPNEGLQPPDVEMSLADYKLLAQGFQYPQDIGAKNATGSIKTAGEDVGDYIRQLQPANSTSTT